VEHQPHVSKRLLLNDAMLWLNDRLGKSVRVAVVYEKGDLPVTVLGAEGSYSIGGTSRTAQRCRMRYAKTCEGGTSSGRPAST
jgi:hypothetical protein